MTAARRLSAAIAALVLPAAGLVATASPAAADPVRAKNAQFLELACDDGNTYQIVVNGNGQWSPGHDLASNRVLIPVAFGETSVVATDAAGNVVFEDSEPPITKGAGRNADVTCTFSATFEFDDPEFGPVTATVTGTVSAKVTPGGRGPRGNSR